MSRLTQTPPLINLNPTPLVPVQVHFNEPFLQQQGSRKTRIALQLLALFGRLELILAKKESLEEALMIDDISKAMLKKLSKEKNALELQLDATWIQLDAKETIYRRTMLYDMKLHELFPRAVNDMDSTILRSTGDVNISAHYRQVALHDQLYAIAVHLYHNLTFEDHKYIPHHLAMIYQCLAQLDSSFGDYRMRLQKNFESIQLHIVRQQQENNGLPPTLTENQIAMLEKLLREMIEQIIYGTETSQPTRTRQYKLLSEAVLAAQKHTCAGSDQTQ